MGTCSWVLPLRMTFFFPNGTADLARQPGEMRVRAFVRKLCTSTKTRTSRCWPTCLAFCSGCCYVDAIAPLCPREKLTYVCGDALCFGQIPRYVPLLNVLFPAGLWSASVAIVEIGHVLHVDCGGSCRSQGYVFGCFCRQRYVLTNHVCGFFRIVTVLVKNEAHCSLIRLIGSLLSRRHASCTYLALCRRTGGRHCAFAIVCPMSLSTASSTLGFRF